MARRYPYLYPSGTHTRDPCGLPIPVLLPNICTHQLGVLERVVANEPMSTQLKASIKLYEDVIKHRLGDWLA